ncbi:SDR family oxidoreductase [Sulfurimonas sp. SAG-AH-194-I05]|nr:SDR family oxidoreductase [Sulfurimonas sp. SAG-AH-194-I05]MDF1876056.1 SDR family oxidoreductase [Sulfurimonas sp. SAG-AH-194-I05]
MSKDIILIIGASSDIGLNLIKNIREGALIIAHYNSSNEQLLELSKNIDNELVTVKADLSKEDEINKLLETIELNCGIPSKIIQLAAPKFENIRFKDIVWDNFQNEINISLKSTILILNRFLPKMAKLKQGKIVLMLSSVVINVPPKALTQYTTIKYAMLGLVKSLASEYANKNIQINAVSPSMIETKFLDNINEKFVELNAYNHPLKRNANIDEITPIIEMLISKESDYINGVNIPITGGSAF